jgi:hypothetical protein
VTASRKSNQPVDGSAILIVDKVQVIPLFKPDRLW